MNQELELQNLLEAAARRRLTAAERDFVRLKLGSGEHREQFELDQCLVAALDRSQFEPSSNFTQRVLQQVRLEERANNRNARNRAFSGKSLLTRWLPRLAFGCLVIAGGYFSYDRLTLQKRTEMAQSVAVIARPSLPPAILQDFDAIEAMSSTPVADEQLLALMK